MNEVNITFGNMKSVGMTRHNTEEYTEFGTGSLMDPKMFLDIHLVSPESTEQGDLRDESNVLHEFIPRSISPESLSCGDILILVSQLIHHNPYFSSIPNQYGELPISKVWRSYQHWFEKSINEQRDLRDSTNPLHSVWRVICVLLFSARCLQGRPTLVTGENILHAAAATYCPIDLIRFILRLFPELAKERDSRGRLPLHLVASTKLDGYRNEELDEYKFNIIDNECETLQLKHDTSKLKLIIQSYPKAAHALDFKNKLPLHYAIEVGQGWFGGVLELLNGNLEVLQIVDEASNMYPFQKSACSAGSDLDTVYELFRAFPEISSHLQL